MVRQSDFSAREVMELARIHGLGNGFDWHEFGSGADTGIALAGTRTRLRYRHGPRPWKHYSGTRFMGDGRTPQEALAKGGKRT